MRSPAYWFMRGYNGLAKLCNGLTPFGESVWPGAGNDLFVAHASIYASPPITVVYQLI